MHRNSRFSLLLILALVVALLPIAPGQLPRLTRAADAPERPSPQQQVDAILPLATYFPDDTLAFAAVRTDQGYIDTLDNLLLRLETAVSPSSAGTLWVSELLEEIAYEATDSGFQSSIRPWLGNVAAAGVLSPVPMYIPEGEEDDYYYYDYFGDYEVAVVAVFAIADRIAATDFAAGLIDDQLAYGDWTRTDRLEYTLFTPEYIYDAGGILVRDDVMVITTNANALPLTGPYFPSLADSPMFLETMLKLAAESYNALVYVDTAMLVATLVGEYEDLTPEARLLLTPLIRLIGPDALGAAILDGRVLTLDALITPGNLTGLESLGLVTEAPVQGVDPGFLANVPGNAALVIHGTNANMLYSTLTATADMAAEPLSEMGGMYSGAAALLPQALDVIFSNITGISYEKDIMPWMMSDYAIFLGYNDAFVLGAEVNAANFPVDAGAIFATADPLAAERFVRKFGRELKLALRAQGINEIAVREEMLGGMPMVTVVLRDYGVDLIEVAVGTNGSMVAFGTPNVVMDVLLPGGTSFQSSQQAYVLPDSFLALYFESAQLRPVFDALLYYGTNPSDVQVMTGLASFIQAGSISVARTEAYDVKVRMALTTAP